jgi:hypothetical protein
VVALTAGANSLSVEASSNSAMDMTLSGQSQIPKMLGLVLPTREQKCTIIQSNHAEQ